MLLYQFGHGFKPTRLELAMPVRATNPRYRLDNHQFNHLKSRFTTAATVSAICPTHRPPDLLQFRGLPMVREGCCKRPLRGFLHWFYVCRLYFSQTTYLRIGFPLSFYLYPITTSQPQKVWCDNQRRGTPCRTSTLLHLTTRYSKTTGGWSGIISTYSFNVLLNGFQRSAAYTLAIVSFSLSAYL